MSDIMELAEQMRQKSRESKGLGFDAGVRVWELAAELTEVAIVEFEDERLSLSRAATECGYSAHGLRRLIHQGKLRSFNEEGEMRVRRGDLPRKPNRGLILDGRRMGIQALG